MLTSEPQGFAAGEYVTWTKTLADYPASAGWVLTYAFVNAAGKFSVTCTASGASHVAAISATASADIAAGVYKWQAKVTKTTEVYLVGAGTLEVAPNFADAELTAFDAATHAETVLAAIEAVIESRATEDQLAVSIAGRSITKMSLAELIQARKIYRQEVADEKAKADQAAGRGVGRHILARFKN